MSEIDHEEEADSEMFLTAALNGEEKWNKFVHLIDTRFQSQARRTNKARQELAQLRAELGPVIMIANAVLWALPRSPKVAGAIVAIVTAITVILSLGIVP